MKINKKLTNSEQNKLFKEKKKEIVCIIKIKTIIDHTLLSMMGAGSLKRYTHRIIHSYTLLFCTIQCNMFVV